MMSRSGILNVTRNLCYVSRVMTEGFKNVQPQHTFRYVERDHMICKPFRKIGSRAAQHILSFSSSSHFNQEDKAREGKTISIEVYEQVKSDFDKVASENESLLHTKAELEDKYLRALADSENLRNRLTRQIQDSKLYAIQGFCKDLLEVSDVIRMAIDSVPKDKVNDSNKDLKQLYEGLSMMEAQLMQTFKRHGVVQINPIDTKFDPNEHEAVVQQEVEGKESGTVVFVSKLGYKLHDRVIRPAVVGVAK